MSGCLQVSEEATIAEDDLLGELGVRDAYADAQWSGQRLDALVERIAARVASMRDEAILVVLARQRRGAIEPWMESLVERELAATTLHQRLTRVLELARLAQRTRTALDFFAD